MFFVFTCLSKLNNFLKLVFAEAKKIRGRSETATELGDKNNDWCKWPDWWKFLSLILLDLQSGTLDL
jgi:hypothetical protein